MDPNTALWLSKARMADLQAEAAEHRLASRARRSDETEGRAHAAAIAASAAPASDLSAAEAACSWFQRLMAAIRRLAPARVIAPRL